jgi:hypothetical protein
MSMQPKTTTKTRKRTGARKRQMQKIVGRALPPDEQKIRTAADAAGFQKSDAAYRIGHFGTKARASAVDDLAAFPHVVKEIKSRQKDYTPRLINSLYVEGAMLVEADLRKIVSHSTTFDKLDQMHTEQRTLIEGAAFVQSCRRIVVRLHNGAANAALRHSFGVGELMRPESLPEVRDGVAAVIEGCEEHPNSEAGRFLKPEMKRAHGLLVQLDALYSKTGEEDRLQSQEAKERNVLHVAIERFFDRFAAAVEGIYADDEASRVRLLQLIPRAPDRRATPQPVPPSPAPAPVPSALTK